MLDITLTTSGIVYDGAGFATMGAGDRIQCPPCGLGASQSWTAFRIRAGFNSPGAINNRILTFGPDTNEEVHLLWRTSGVWGIRRETSGASNETQISDSFVIGDKRTLIFAWTATEIKISLDGAAFLASGNTNISQIGSVDIDFGSRGYAGTEQWVGDFFWVLGGTGTLTDADAATIHGYGDTDPSEVGQPGNASVLWKAISDAGRDLRQTPIQLTSSNPRW